MNDIGRVSELWRYPVSSLGGELMRAVCVDADGVDGDRLFGLVEVATGMVAQPESDPKWAAAPRLRARLLADHSLQVAMPGGSWMPAPANESDLAISAHLGFEASIRPYRRDDAAQSYSGPLASANYRKAPLHLVTTASLARLKALHPTGDPNRRRFRPNILVDMPAVEASFPETEWIGRRLAIGDLELTVSEPCRRCGFTVIAQDGFGDDPEILRGLVRHNGQNLGVYCTVDRPARISTGAAARFG